MKKNVDRHDQNDPLNTMGLRFGFSPYTYRNDDRLRSLLLFKVHLDGAITAARQADDGRLNLQRARRKQQESKTKAELVARISSRYGFTPEETQPGPLIDLIDATANSMIFLALLVPRKRIAKAVTR